MEHLSNADLLALLVGRKAARKMSARPLAELFGFAAPRQPWLSDNVAAYTAHPSLAAAKELVARCLRERMQTEDVCCSSPNTVRAFLCARIGHLEYEAFWCLWLTNKHVLIDAEEMFRGTIDQAKVYPREVVKRALAVNAAAVIFAHNHPSGVETPSHDDVKVTGLLKEALNLIEVRVVDHFVVAGNQAASFAERGLL